MKPLSGLDAVFLHAETATTPMHVIATVVVEGEVDFEALVSRVEARLPDLPPFRRRLVEMPLGLDHPVWIEDPDFDVRAHVARVCAPPPGDDRALERVVARLARGRLDRAKPLWEVFLVDGLSDGRTALVVKAHHAAVDGVSGAALLLHLFDRSGEPDGPAAPTWDDWHAESEPGPEQLVRHGMRRLWGGPARVRGALQHAGRSAAEMVRARLGSETAIREAALPFQAPECPFNGPLSPQRSVAYARAPFGSVQRARGAFGGTVNDVVLSACTRALQGELLERGVLPERPLLAAVPVSTRSAHDGDDGNRLSALVTELPVHLEDPVQQLAEVRRATFRAKRLHHALGDHTLASLAEMTPPGIAQGVLGLYARWKLASLHRPLVNLTVSNVPGPPFALELLGRPVRALHPHGPLMEGVGLNITILSYAGSLDVGVLACRARLPEAHRLAERVAAAVEELAKLAEAALPDVPPLAFHVA